MNREIHYWIYFMKLIYFIKSYGPCPLRVCCAFAMHTLKGAQQARQEVIWKITFYNKFFFFLPFLKKDLIFYYFKSIFFYSFQFNKKITRKDISFADNSIFYYNEILSYQNQLIEKIFVSKVSNRIYKLDPFKIINFFEKFYFQKHNGHKIITFFKLDEKTLYWFNLKLLKLKNKFNCKLLKLIIITNSYKLIKKFSNKRNPLGFQVWVPFFSVFKNYQIFDLTICYEFFSFVFFKEKKNKSFRIRLFFGLNLFIFKFISFLSLMNFVHNLINEGCSYKFCFFFFLLLKFFHTVFIEKAQKFYLISILSLGFSPFYMPHLDFLKKKNSIKNFDKTILSQVQNLNYSSFFIYFSNNIVKNKQNKARKLLVSLTLQNLNALKIQKRNLSLKLISYKQVKQISNKVAISLKRRSLKIFSDFCFFYLATKSLNISDFVARFIINQKTTSFLEISLFMYKISTFCFIFYKILKKMNLFINFFLWNWAKRRHNKKTNKWIFKKYWIFIQNKPYFYFFKNRKIYYLILYEII